MEIAPAGDRSGFVTYSRVEPHREDAADQSGPILTGVEVPNVDDDFGVAPEVRAESRVEHGHRKGMFGMLTVLALVAFAGGVGVLAGSFLFPIAKSTQPGLEKVATASASDSGAGPAVSKPESVPPAKVAAAYAGRTGGTVNRDVFNWPEAAASSQPQAKLDETLARKTAVAVASPLNTNETPAAPPIPRDRPPQKIADTPTIEPKEPIVVPKAAERKVEAPRLTGPAPTVETAPPPVPQIDQPEIAAADTQPLPPPVDVTPQGPTADKAPLPPRDIPQGDVFAANPEYGAPMDGGGWHEPADESAAPMDSATAEDLDQTYQSALDHWIVLGVRDGRAVIDGRERGVFMVEAGSEIPGVGIVETIKRRHGRWIVVTSAGSISSPADQGRRRFWLSRLLH